MSPVVSLQQGSEPSELKRKRAEEEASAAPVAKQPVHQPSNHNTFDNDKAESWRENMRCAGRMGVGGKGSGGSGGGIRCPAGAAARMPRPAAARTLAAAAVADCICCRVQMRLRCLSRQSRDAGCPAAFARTHGRCDARLCMRSAGLPAPTGALIHPPCIPQGRCGACERPCWRAARLVVVWPQAC